MGHLEFSRASYHLPDGGSLLHDVSFRVRAGAKVALIGANGTGKTTLVRLVAGELEPTERAVARSGPVGMLRQFVSRTSPGLLVRQLLAEVWGEPLASAAATLAGAERQMRDADTAAAAIDYAAALAAYGDAGGWDAEVHWDAACRAAVGEPFHAVADRPVGTFSGGEQKRLALEALLEGPADLLLLDEPDSHLDIAGKGWLEQRLRQTPKTVLFVSHDRELIAQVAARIVTLEGGSAWTHEGTWATYEEARRKRIVRYAERRRRWNDEHRRLRALVATLRQQAARSSDMSSRFRAAETRLRRFEAAGPPAEPPSPRPVTMRLRGQRTGDRALRCEGLALTGLTEPFDFEAIYGERIAVIGANGSGKSSLLRILTGQDLPHTGTWRLGARVTPGYFAQMHDRPDLVARTPLELLAAAGLDRTRAMAALSRYGLTLEADRRYERLSGGQQARVQILMLESAGATLLLLDEPTDNLDILSAEALEHALKGYRGTVLAATHDRCFARSFDRYLAFGRDGRVTETHVPPWEGAPQENEPLMAVAR